MPIATPMMAELPAHMPSMPSFKLAPFDTAVTTKIVMKTNNTQPAAVLYLPQNDIIFE